MCLNQEADMQKTLAWVALALAGSLVGCARDKYREPTSAKVEPRGHSTPTEVAKSEVPVQLAARQEPNMTPASGTREMTPASGTRAARTEPGPELAVTSRGPVLLQHEAANELAAAICEQQSACGENASGDCERTVSQQSESALAGCDHGLSRTEFYVCLTAIAEKACGTKPIRLTECSAASLCLP
jgi:hypothetical protein